MISGLRALALRPESQEEKRNVGVQGSMPENGLVSEVNISTRSLWGKSKLVIK